MNTIAKTELVLVVDDEPAILDVMRSNLKNEGFDVHCVATGEEALSFARANTPDLIVLDLMLPGMHGFEVCKRLKADARTAQVPVVMLTARGEDADIIRGLELGAEDYVTKPFRRQVLNARIKAVLRRSRAMHVPTNEPLEVHDFKIDTARHEVLVSETRVDLTKTEFNLLHLLASNPGQVYTRNQIIDGVKGEDYPATDRSVDVQVVGLRRKLGDFGNYIETVRGIGYRMKE